MKSLHKVSREWSLKGTDHEKNRRVAIKVLSPDQTSSDEERERFVRAMRTMLPFGIAIWLPCMRR